MDEIRTQISRFKLVPVQEDGRRREKMQMKREEREKEKRQEEEKGKSRQ